jgi:hypothetical protein
MEDYREIYLQPPCCEDPAVGRLWCEHVPQECECDTQREWTRYVRADLAKPIKILSDRDRAEVALDALWALVGNGYGTVYERAIAELQRLLDKYP